MKSRYFRIILFPLLIVVCLVVMVPQNGAGSQGNGVVEIKTVKKNIPRGGELFLQVGVFSVSNNAEALLQTLRKHNLPTKVEKLKNREGRIRRGVYVGPFMSEGGALLVKDRVREITGISPILIKKELIQSSRVRVKDEKKDTLQPVTPLQGKSEVIGMSSLPKSLNGKSGGEADTHDKNGIVHKTGTGEKTTRGNRRGIKKPGQKISPAKIGGTKIAKNGQRASGGGGISMDFNNVDISALIKFVSEVTGKNFVYDERVRGKITIVSPKKISVEEAYKVFISVLQVKGFTTVEQGNMAKIVPLRQAKQEGLKTFTGGKGNLSDQFITQLIPLRYIKVREASTFLSPLVSKEGLLSSYEPSNTLIIIDKGSNIARIIKIISELDINRAAQVIRLYRLKNAPTEDVADILSQLFSALNGSASPRAHVRGARTNRRTTQGSFKGIKFISDNRTNSLIVLSPRESLNKIEGMIRKLDIPAPQNVGKINVFYLENADSGELASVLNTLINGAGVRGKGAVRNRSATIKGIIAPEFEGAIKITSDKATNSLIIVASQNDFRTLSGVIKKLDIKRRQVYVEALIMEISIDKGRDLGVEFRGAGEPSNNSAALLGSNFDFTGNVNDFLSALAVGNPLLLSGAGITAGVIGGKVILPDGTEVPAITAILRAAEVATNVHVLATPHLLTTDNEEAEIIVGENVPFITSQQRDTTNLANIINQVERNDVGITLRIKPQIHESKYVKLDLFQESSAIKEGTSLLDPNLVGPTTTKRSAKTSIIVKSEQTIVLGGLMQERKVNKVSKVPLLGDIPLLGWLFSFKSVNVSKTNLLIFLTPHIIKDTAELTGITLDMQKSMKRFIKKNKETGTDQMGEEYMDYLGDNDE